MFTNAKSISTAKHSGPLGARTNAIHEPSWFSREDKDSRSLKCSKSFGNVFVHLTGRT